MRITGMKVTRKLVWDKVRQICIDRELYTCGTNSEYDQMLSRCKEDMSDPDYFLMAEDIYNHSDLDRLCNQYGCDEEEILRSILSDLINASWQVVYMECEED